MTFQTVEQLQAQIANLTGEVERLTNENWRLQAGEAVMLKPHLGLISRLTAEIERLREACRLFVEYDDHNEGSAITLILLYNAAITATRAALQPKEGNQ